ncbi:hypothetical protein EVAR_14922_1 [Eumeta japonica]|uniref:Uncharacterized protein n=1 Tax=Eumeta variegata TaxID=151549 RepID=A0A4C1XP51_EUMVA|nr:hypothetical protein EVAR_14922_1 [Eumeta japonica]
MPKTALPNEMLVWDKNEDEDSQQSSAIHFGDSKQKKKSEIIGWFRTLFIFPEKVVSTNPCSTATILVELSGPKFLFDRTSGPSANSGSQSPPLQS